MPPRAKSPCTYPGCAEVVDRPGRCDKHKASAQWVKNPYQRGKYGSRWRKLRERILRRDMGLCQVCLALDIVTLAYAVDHITPRSKGGTDDEQNLRAICRGCHAEKTAREGVAARQRDY